MDGAAASGPNLDPSKQVLVATSDHLLLGGVYSVLANQYGRGDFVLAKIVHLTPAVVHVVIYPPSFKQRPAAAQVGVGTLSLSGGLNEARERHVAMSRKLFSLIRPVYLCDLQIDENDLAGFRRWSLLIEKEILEAPAYIEPEANDGVYKRIFLFCGLPFGLLQGIYHYCRDGLVPGVFAFVFSFVLFGAGMAATQYLAMRRRLNRKKDKSVDKSAGTDNTAFISPTEARASASAFQVAEMQVDRSFGDTFALCQQAIRSVKNCRVCEEDFSGGTIEGKVGFSLTSEGEQIVLTTYAVSPERTGVVVASMPRAGGEVDLGKNFDNVECIVGYLKIACK